jgi:hypothetical protein
MPRTASGRIVTDNTSLHSIVSFRVDSHIARDYVASYSLRMLHTPHLSTSQNVQSIPLREDKIDRATRPVTQSVLIQEDKQGVSWFISDVQLIRAYKRYGRRWRGRKYELYQGKQYCGWRPRPRPWYGVVGGRISFRTGVC